MGVPDEVCDHLHPAQWRRTMSALTPLNHDALAAFELLDANLPAAVRSRPVPIHAAFTDAAARHALLEEFDQVREAGYPVEFTPMSADDFRAIAPAVSNQIEAVIRIDGQRTINPGRYVAALAAQVRDRGGEVRSGAEVRRLRHGPGGVAVDIAGNAPITADAVVLATGAWLPELAKAYGVRTRLRAGRGYSFSVEQHEDDAIKTIGSPVYFPQQRVVCSPLRDSGGEPLGCESAARWSSASPMQLLRRHGLTRSCGPQSLCCRV
ncbi:FAD-dependent oxidoreductase [Ornithinimicrobium sp. INDO-MA30-4]|uniref:NAD(P)/FAD-dependent oxidoreductase n=1 Tax=Ornithinimicrobium sp. INDO-MA30-4 TaxID=2908651 RepID=UPI0028830DCF|nr:FAD-dependent oxidoreductase [Ornithinimicrobium sp. INDO-MA30-4]